MIDERKLSMIVLGIPVIAAIIFLVVFIILPALPAGTTSASVNPFEKLSDNICLEDGKPLIRYYSTTWCPHCQYINPVFNKVMAEYGNKIVYRHFEVDLNTPSEFDLIEFKKFAPNGNIPAFSFGCEYYRIGNSFEAQQDTNAEAAEFRRVIDLLLEEIK